MSDDELERKFEEAVSRHVWNQWNQRFVLDDADEPVVCKDLMTWARWFEQAGPQRKLRVTETKHYTVHTSFLGLNHNFIPGGPPLLWETMISFPENNGEAFGVKLNTGWCDYQTRYPTKFAAIEGHEIACAWAREHFRWYKRWWRWLKHFAHRVRSCLAYEGDPG